MKLKRKINIVIFTSWILLLILLYAGSKFILEKSYLQLEHEESVAQLSRGMQALEQMNAGVSLIASSNAIWNDSYQFVQDKNKAFIDTNLQIETILGFGADMLLFFSEKGQPVYYSVANHERTALTSLPEGFSDYLTPKSKLVYQPNVDSSAYGLVNLPSGLLLTASHAIVKGDNSGPVKGSLVAVKYFDKEALNKLRDVTKLDIKILPVQELKTNPALLALFTSLKTSNAPLIETKKGTLYGYSLLKDINGQPIGLITLTLPRSIYTVGTNSINFFSISFLISGILVLMLMTLLISKLITKRLEKVNEQLITIGETMKFDTHLHEEGADELTSVEVEINRMLHVIQAYNAEQQTFLDKVTQAQLFLTSIINAMHSSIVIADSNFNIVQANTAAEKETKLSTEQLSGQSIFSVFPYVKPHETRFSEAMLQNKSQMISRISYRKGRDNVFYSLGIYPLIRETERFYVLRIDDISESVKVQEHLSEIEKLASVGTLTAGVAHEINNPINFVSSSVNPIRADVADLMSVLSKFLELKSIEQFSEQLPKIHALAKDIDIAYTLKEINTLLDGIKEGADRTALIVRDLNTFSQVGEDSLEKKNITDLLESTLTLLSYHLKDRITVEKDYGATPSIECLPGKLSQVFMNLINNAIDAIKDKGVISIKTSREDDVVRVSIKDTGVGISEDNLPRIFEPFFTTKAVGKGPGLGMSIVYGIIQSHHGTIEVTSKVGVGTEFRLTLPIMQPKNR